MDTMKPNETRPLYVREWRLHRLMTLAELAKASGLSPKTVWSLEQPGHTPYVSTVRKVAEALEIKGPDLYRLPREEDLTMIVPTIYKLREWRRAKGLTQAELAARAGTYQPHVSDYEKGAKEPTRETAGRLAGALGITVFDLRQYPKPQPD